MGDMDKAGDDNTHDQWKQFNVDALDVGSVRWDLLAACALKDLKASWSDFIHWISPGALIIY